MKQGTKVQVRWSMVPHYWRLDQSWVELRELTREHDGVVLRAKAKNVPYNEVDFGGTLYRLDDREIIDLSDPEFYQMLCPACEERLPEDDDYLCHQCRFGV